MALNLANDDDGGSCVDFPQIKESAESYPGKKCSVFSYRSENGICRYVHSHCTFSSESFFFLFERKRCTSCSLLVCVACFITSENLNVHSMI